MWQSGDLGQLEPSQIVVGGDTVYLAIPQTANATTNLAALNISNGSARWRNNLSTNSTFIYSLMADDQQLYAVGDTNVLIYSKDGTGQSQGFYIGIQRTPAVLKGRLIIANSFGDLSNVPGRSSQPFPLFDYQNQHYYSNIFAMAASNGLLFLTTNDQDGDLFGNTRLLAFDLQSGRQVWRSPTLSGDFSTSQIIIGNGMLYMIYGSEIHAYAGAR